MILYIFMQTCIEKILKKKVKTKIFHLAKILQQFLFNRVVIMTHYMHIIDNVLNALLFRPPYVWLLTFTWHTARAQLSLLQRHSVGVVRLMS